MAAALPLAPPANATTPADGSHGRGVTSSPAGQAGIAWKHCEGMGKRFQCARVAVPLNWHRPAGTHIKLAVIRFLGSDQKHRIGSMFVNPGGPGSSGVGIVRDMGPMLSAWGRGRFNVVGWDPRGTNASDPVRCFTSQAAEARFWRGVQTPATPAQSRAFARRGGRPGAPVRSGERAGRRLLLLHQMHDE